MPYVSSAVPRSGSGMGFPPGPGPRFLSIIPVFGSTLEGVETVGTELVERMNESMNGKIRFPGDLGVAHGCASSLLCVSSHDFGLCVIRAVP